MAKIDLITLSGLSASDGSVIASGATVKFATKFEIGDTDVRIFPKIWRNRELFDTGFTSIQVTNETLPDDILIEGLTDEQFYNLTPATIYGMVRDWLNNYYGEDIIEVSITY